MMLLGSTEMRMGSAFAAACGSQVLPCMHTIKHCCGQVLLRAVPSADQRHVDESWSASVSLHSMGCLIRSMLHLCRVGTHRRQLSKMLMNHPACQADTVHFRGCGWCLHNVVTSRACPLG